MTISKNAWHYRYMAWLGLDRPRRLCPYFWKLVFSLMVPVVFTAVVLAVLAGLTWVAIHVGPSIVAWLVQNAHAILFAIGVVAAAISLAYGCIVLMGWLFSSETYAVRRSIAHSDVVTKAGKGASLTGSYLVAWHHKVCPFLEFTE